MAGFVKLAVAGAGKTTELGNMINPKNRNLLITYTNQNVTNLKNSVKIKSGSIPDNTVIMTYTKFLYYWVIKPNEQFFILSSGEELNSNGMTINKPIEQDYHNPNNGYVKNEHAHHYLDQNNNYYVKRLSELFVRQKNKVKEIVRKYIGNFVDGIYIDEFQDFIGYDYKFLLDLAKGNYYDVYMVGDYYQSSVSSTSIGNGKITKLPYEKYDYKSFIEELEKKKIEVDTKSLEKSYRCPPQTCKFIREKLKINIFSAKPNSTYGIKTIEKVEDAIKILKDDKIVKLLYNKASNGFNKLNNKNKWGYSKGNTFSKTCVILTEPTSNFIFNNDTKVLKKTRTIHMLYVALTRSSTDTYLISKEIFDKAIGHIFD